ncbi:hypothetical protein ACGTNG_12685 [Halomonas sp. 1390]|uniref:hypothetical protein n=1 Tax=Halomonas sp. B23F22_3 TaxID=3459516 RepID=UPI00373FB4C3
MLSRIAEGDRRHKPEGEHLDNPTRVRWKDAEFVSLEKLAAMRHEGVIAHAIRECALIGMDVLEARQDVLLARLAENLGMEHAQEEMLAALMANLVEARISERLDQRQTA